MATIYRWIGRTILVYNYRGDGLYRMIRVTAIRDTHDHLVKLRTMLVDNPRLQRGRYLVTGTDLDRGIMRSYYINHSEVTEVGFFGRLYHRILTKIGIRDGAA